MARGVVHGGWWRGLCRVAAVLLLAQSPAVLAGGGAAEPDVPRWRELHFQARKLIVTADTWVRLDVLSAAAAAKELVVLAGPAPLAPRGERVVRVELETSLLGRRTRNSAWLEPASAAVLQTVSRDIGTRPRLKIQRFGEEGVAIARSTPGRGEEGLPSDRWTQRSAATLVLPAVGRAGVPVSDSVALFWILASGRLARPGDTVEVTVLSRSRLLVASVVVKAAHRLDLDFDERSAAGDRHVGERLDGLELAIDARPLDPAAGGADFEFLGLKGSVRILLDPTRRLPVEVSGAVPNVGTVVVRLQDVTVRD
jgi:hypothetical protein